MASSGEEPSGGSPGRAGTGSEAAAAAADAAPLDTAEDFEVLEEEGEEDEDDLSELPPLEDVGRAPAPPREDAQRPVRDAAGAAEEWLDVLGNGLLKKKTLVPGQGAESRPQKGQDVTIRLKAALEDGTVVEQEPALTFTLGDCDVLQALDLCVQLLEMGETALIVSDAKYCYRAQGRVVGRGAGWGLITPQWFLPIPGWWDVGQDGASAVPVHPRVVGRGAGWGLITPQWFLSIPGCWDVGQDGASSPPQCIPGWWDVGQDEASAVPAHPRVVGRGAGWGLSGSCPSQGVGPCCGGQVPSLAGRDGAGLRAARSPPQTIHAELSKLVKKHADQRNVETEMYRKMLGNPSTAGAPGKCKDKLPWSIPWKWLFGATAIALGGVALSVVIAARN
ncbi:FKBP8 isomerase, partial [Calcarius ornatus]|nr:FKBP8 isomerase [Calcarius ornatus]